MSASEGMMVFAETAVLAAIARLPVFRLSIATGFRQLISTTSTAAVMSVILNGLVMLLLPILKNAQPLKYAGIEYR